MTITPGSLSLNANTSKKEFQQRISKINQALTLNETRKSSIQQNLNSLGLNKSSLKNSIQALKNQIGVLEVSSASSTNKNSNTDKLANLSQLVTLKSQLMEKQSKLKGIEVKMQEKTYELSKTELKNKDLKSAKKNPILN